MKLAVKTSLSLNKLYQVLTESSKGGYSVADKSYEANLLNMVDACNTIKWEF